MSLVLQPRDELVLGSLARAVRLLTLLQVAFLRGADAANTRRRMKRLQQHGFVEERRIFCEPPPDVSKPLGVWEPHCGQPLLNEHELSYAAQNRYRLGPGPKHITAYVPTFYTLEHFGGPKKRGPRFAGVGRSKQHQLTHDVGFSEAFVRCNVWPKREWVGEDLFIDSGPGVKIPDGLICTDGDVTKPKAAVDYLSKYGPSRILELMTAISERNLPFAFY